MPKIYEPKGAAREYSPLALNHINGCDHACFYCYVPKIVKRFNSAYVHSDVFIREEKKLLKEIENSAKAHAGSEKQVMLSFLTDPYSKFNAKTGITRKVLEILYAYQIPVSILSKGGYRLYDDLDLFKKFGKNIQIGGSLTLTSAKDSMKYERGAALPEERFEVLEAMHNEGIRTWASIEPVIIPEQSLEILERCSPYVDGFKIGKLNHFEKFTAGVDWSKFLVDAVNIMRKNNKLFYIKKDLLAFKPKDLKLKKHETDMDYMTLKNTFAAKALF